MREMKSLNIIKPNSNQIWTPIEYSKNFKNDEHKGKREEFSFHIRNEALKESNEKPLFINENRKFTQSHNIGHQQDLSIGWNHTNMNTEVIILGSFYFKF